MIPETPPKYYWAQCYEIGKRTHWALRDTHTDAQGQPERVSSYDMVLWAHRSKDIAESPIPKLIAQLLTDHYAKQPPLAETPYSTPTTLKIYELETIQTQRAVRNESIRNR